MEFVLFKDNIGEHRWKLLAANNKVIASSGEGYHAKADCIHGINLVRDCFKAPVREIDLTD